MCYKRLLLTLVAGVLMLTGFAGLREEFKANPRMSANNYWAYPDKDLPALTPAPGDYEPFFINHYGRHGSRWRASILASVEPVVATLLGVLVYRERLSAPSALGNSLPAASRCSTRCGS